MTVQCIMADWTRINLSRDVHVARTAQKQQRITTSKSHKNQDDSVHHKPPLGRPGSKDQVSPNLGTG